MSLDILNIHLTYGKPANIAKTPDMLNTAQHTHTCKYTCAHTRIWLSAALQESKRVCMLKRDVNGLR